MRRWVLLLGLVACADHDGPSNVPYTPLNEVEQRYHVAECQRFVRCGLVTDQATCEATTTDALRSSISPMLINDLYANHLAYDGGMVDACIAAVANASCSPFDVAVRDPITTCVEAAITARGQTGDACETNDACISGACATCNVVDECCMGMCVDSPSGTAPVKNAPLGASCKGNVTCAAGLQCDYATTMTCQPLSPEGADCPGQVLDGGAVPNTCADGLFCDFSLHCARPDPTSCANTGVCADISTGCNANTGMCIPIPNTVGGSCGATGCAPGLACGSTNQCVALSSTNQPCGQGCADYGTYCDVMNHDPPICVPWSKSGALCNDNDACASGWCDEYATCSDCN
ncbi:MAG: hypothetical protein QM831_18495 [Kofleriaceae bacterium]